MLNHEGGTLKNGISAIAERLWKDPQPVPPGEDMARVTGYELGRGLSPEHDHAGTLILDFPDSRTMNNTSLLLINYPVCSTVIQHPK